MSEAVPPSKGVVAFGPFRLFVSERRVENSGAPVQLGSRSLDILTVLIEQAGEVVTKRQLIARVWPGITVDESSLRVHVAALRKALGDGQGGARYITNIQGRGYCFVAPLTHQQSLGFEPSAATTADREHRLPARLARMIGRDEAVDEIAEQLRSRRFVTVVGPGGIGKTTVVVALGHALLAEFDGDVRFLDLGPLTDPRLVPTVLASALGIIAQSTDPTPGLINDLRDRRILLIFDSCEHVVDSVAMLAERIFAEAPQVHIVATSREALRVEGEFVHFLSPLDTPPDIPGLTPAETLAFPAAQLFLERAIAGGYRPGTHSDEVHVVAEICRKLDGIALAIELAAGRAGGHGLLETAAMLDDRFRLLWRGRRTALPRHQTLSAMLDWSYELLGDAERTVLRRLSIFVGAFTREAAKAVAGGSGLHDVQFDSLGSLVSKSLLSARTGNTTTFYRLLDSTRAYAVGKLVESGESEQTARRHADYFRELLERPREATDTVADELALANVRAALEWSFSDHGDTQLGTALAAAAAHMFLDLSLLSECRRWAEQAINALDDTSRGTHREMELQAALGLSLMFTRGNSEGARIALMRGLELAEQLGDIGNQLRLLGRLHIFHERAGQFEQAFVFARRSEAVAREIADPVGVAAAHSVLGISHHLAGNNDEARAHLDASLAQPRTSRRINTTHFGFHHQNRARIALARTLWLQGYADQSAEVVRQTLDEATTLGHPITLSIAIIWGLTVFNWIGDHASAQENIERLGAIANRHSLGPYIAASIGMRGRLTVQCGDAEAGAAMLRQSLDLLHADHYELLTTEFTIALAEALAAAGHADDASVLLDETIRVVEDNGDLFTLPELLRLKGDVLASADEPELALVSYARSLELANRQAALGWALRTTVGLARLHLKEGRRDEARNALSAVYGRFTEGFDTPDLAAAKQLLEGLDTPPAGLALSAG